ncbi:MAG: DNA repair protein RecO [Planctomycetaceae bacterium]|nr:DNA repair protein RecO [Planctomycetaceae bacterium]
MPTIKDQAICIRSVDWSETSQIVVLLTEQHGKISATAKGAKRQTTSTIEKFSGGVDLLAAGEAVLIARPASDLANLTEWDLHQGHWHLRHDLSAFEAAMYAADLVHHLLSDRDAHPRTYQALRRFLLQLARPDDQAPALLTFQWALADDLGYRPVLDRDAQTGQPIDDNALTLAFNPIAGGLVADTGADDRWRVRQATVLALRSVAAGDDIPPQAAENLLRANRLLCAYFRAILDRQLPTMDYLLVPDKTML